MTQRPTKPPFAVSRVELRRVATISPEELAETTPYGVVDPRTLPGLLAWLRVDLATSDVNGVSSVPDAFGGSAATQSTNAQKPTLGTTSNGIAKLTLTDDCLVIPNQAAFNNTAWFGMGLWLKPANLTSSDIFNMTTVAGSSQNRFSFRQTNDDVVSFIWHPDATNTRVAQTNNSRAFLFANEWKFVCMEFVGAEALEANRSRFKDMGTLPAFPNLPLYTDGVGTLGFTPPTLLTPTGNSLLFARTPAGGNPFVGDVTDVFFYNPTLLTGQNLVKLAQRKVPIG